MSYYQDQSPSYNGAYNRRSARRGYQQSQTRVIDARAPEAQPQNNKGANPASDQIRAGWGWGPQENASDDIKAGWGWGNAGAATGGGNTGAGAGQSPATGAGNAGGLISTLPTYMQKTTPAVP